jgi:hypothetical protein
VARWPSQRIVNSHHPVAPVTGGIANTRYQTARRDMPGADFGLQPAKLILRPKPQKLRKALTARGRRRLTGENDRACATTRRAGAQTRTADTAELSHLVVLDAKPITAAVVLRRPVIGNGGTPHVTIASPPRQEGWRCGFYAWRNVRHV